MTDEADHWNDVPHLCQFAEKPCHEVVLQIKNMQDTQLGVFPGRSTFQPLIIVRHLKQAANKLRPGGSPGLHVAS